MYKTGLYLLTAMTLFSCNSPKNNKGEEESKAPYYLLVGSYSSPEEEGIHVYTFNEENGESNRVSGLKGISNPSYLQPSADGRFVYAVAEDNPEVASANALAFSKSTGELTFLNSQKTTGADPCYITTDSKRRMAATANYTGGSISVFPVTVNGDLLPATQIFQYKGTGTDPERQEKPHMHTVIFSPDEKYLLATDLGTDVIRIMSVNYESEEKLFLTAAHPATYELEAGSGPRHLCFHPNGNFLYLINELSGQVHAFTYDEGKLDLIQTIVADSVGARGSVDIHITPDGKFLYASNRLQADGLAIFKVDAASGQLTHVGYQDTGIHPRNFIITPNGKYLLVACRDSNMIQVFSINNETGTLTDTKKNIYLSQPVCLKFIR